MKKKMETTETVEEKLNFSLNYLANYIENNYVTGTSVTTAFGEMKIKNKKWQIQIRLECDDIIDTREIFQSKKY